MPSYDKAITIFAPDGNLYQVSYAFEAVNRGTCTVGIRGKDCVVFAVEKKSVAKLQDPHTIKKILPIDDHITLTFSGLQADARVLANKARLECQSYRFNMEEEPSVEYLARWIAKTQQQYTQKGGVRPFGISTLIMGFDEDNTPKLYQTEPSGSYSCWKAQCVGRQSKSVREFLEKNYEEEMDLEKCCMVAVEALLDVVESSKNIEIVYMKKERKTEMIPDAQIEEYVKAVEKKKEQKA